MANPRQQSKIETMDRPTSSSTLATRAFELYPTMLVRYPNNDSKGAARAALQAVRDFDSVARDFGRPAEKATA